MNEVFQTVPSFTINKKEFFLLWAKHSIILLNTKVLDDKLQDVNAPHGASPAEEFLRAFRFITDKVIMEQLEEIQRKRTQIDNELQNQSDHQIFNNNIVWAIKHRDILDLKFMLAFLVVINSREFSIQIGSVSDLVSLNVEQPIFDEILSQMKTFFINRNLDGKGIFKVLSKQAQVSHG